MRWAHALPAGPPARGTVLVGYPVTSTLCGSLDPAQVLFTVQIDQLHDPIALSLSSALTSKPPLSRLRRKFPFEPPSHDRRTGFFPPALLPNRSLGVHVAHSVIGNSQGVPRPCPWGACRWRCAV